MCRMCLKFHHFTEEQEICIVNLKQKLRDDKVKSCYYSRNSDFLTSPIRIFFKPSFRITLAVYKLLTLKELRGIPGAVGTSFVIVVL